MDFDERPLMKERFLEINERIAANLTDPVKVNIWQQIQLSYAIVLREQALVMEEFDMVIMKRCE